MKNNAKFEEELACPFKIDMGNLTIFTRALESLKNLRFKGILATKVYKARAKKVQRTYLS